MKTHFRAGPMLRWICQQKSDFLLLRDSFVCLFFSRERKNMKLDGQEERRIWEELGTGKNRIKIYFMKFSENTFKKMVHWIKVLAT